MAEEIQGIGKQGAGVNRMGVTEEKRAMVDAVSQTVEEHAAEEGRSFNVNTGTITLTTANKSALLYMKNTGSVDLIIPTVGYLIGNSTGGTGDLIPEIILNPTTGTIVSDETAVEMNVNKNAGSSKVLSVDAYKGTEGKTLTNGTMAYGSLLAGAARGYVIGTGNIILPAGSSIGSNVTPQASNSNMDIQIFFAVIEKGQ